MFELPQDLKNEDAKAARALQLEESQKDRVPQKEKGYPTRHSAVPLEEQNLFLATSRQLYINSIRYWISWARIGWYNLFWNSPPSIHKHHSTIWLFPKPQNDEVLKYPLEDSFFAKQRFCGPQNSLITRVKQLPEWAPKLETLQTKCRNGDLFVVDYGALKGSKVKPGAYLPWVMGLFSYQNEVYRTECVYVDGKICTPENDGFWAYAKACFQVNDSVYFFAVNRLCGAFLFLEPITLYFFRNIPTKHPLYPLLKPLFFGHATACQWVRKMILKDDGLINQMLPLSTEGVQDLVKMAYERWNFETTNFVTKVSQRNMNDCQGYAYAEDGSELFEVVQTIAAFYTNTVYPTESDILKDTELQKWLSDTAGEGAVKGFPAKVATKGMLTQLLAHLIFLFLFDRYMVHYSLYEHMAFMPSFPLSIEKYAEHSAPLTSDEVLHLLSCEKRTLAQIHAMYVFCYEILPCPQWGLQEMPRELADLMTQAEKQFQLRRIRMRERVKNRPTPFRHFLVQSGFFMNLYNKN